MPLRRDSAATTRVVIRPKGRDASRVRTGASAMSRVSYTHLTLPTTPYV